MSLPLVDPPSDRRSLERRISNLSHEGEWEVSLEELNIGEKIGHGAFGCVRLAFWRGTEVAIKVLYDKTIDLHEFYMEMIILTRLHHPNVLQVLGCCTTQVPYTMLLEHMPNGSLLPYVHSKGKKRGVLKTNQKIDILKDVSRGLAYIHNRRPYAIIHRDLKPSNILLTTSFKAKIADFGISSIKPAVEEFYQMTGETGTYRYMAPEVLRSEKYNCKVDIWSLGMIVYALFVEEPFTWCIDEREMFKELSGRHPTKRFCSSTMASSIKCIFDRTTCLNPTERWDSMYLVQYCNVELKDGGEGGVTIDKMGCFSPCFKSFQK